MDHSLIPRRVLIVDDNREAADSSAELLQYFGQTTQAAYHGHEALRIAADFLPDVVFLDLGMPDLDGFEVAQRMRSMPELGHTLIVAITGRNDALSKAKARAAGFNAHLSKPASVESLIDVLLATPGVGMPAPLDTLRPPA